MNKKWKAVMQTNMNTIIVIFIMILFVLIFTILVSHYKINRTDLKTLLNDLITVTGIFSGIILSFLSIKVFQIREKKEAQYKELNDLSRKLMFYKRICYTIFSSLRFWKTYEDITEFEQKFKNISFSEIHSNSNNKEENRSQEFWLATDLCISKSKADLYLAFKLIVDEGKSVPDWQFSRYRVIKFSKEYLNEISMPCNQIWYYLDYKYKKHLEGSIEIDKLNSYETSQIRENVAEIESKYKGKEIDRFLIAEISADFHELYLPKLIKLTEHLEIMFPKPLISLFYPLVFIILTGVLIPLTILLFDIGKSIFDLLAAGSVISVLFGIIALLLLFYSFIRNEMKII